MSKCSKTHPRASLIPKKNFRGLYPEPLLKGERRGGDRTGSEKRGGKSCVIAVV